MKRDTHIVKDPNLGVILQSHEMEKLASYLIRLNREENSESENYEEVDNLLKRLDIALDDFHRAFNASSIEKRNKLPAGTIYLETLKKYRHNLLSVIKDNNMILTTKNKEVNKELVGNKGYNLWFMKNELGVNVPECLFLTTEYAKVALTDRALPEQSNLLQLFLYFEGKEVAVRSSGVVSMPGMLDTIFLGKNHTSDNLFDAIRTVIESWNTPKAIKYRKLCKISDDPQIAVVIQEKVDCEHPAGFSGICFTRDVITGEPGLNGEFLNGILGDELASGRMNGNPIQELPSAILEELKEVGTKLEKHYRRPQDIEWAHDGEKLYILQTRNARLSHNAMAKIYLDMWDEGIITDFAELQDLVWDAKAEDNKRYRKSSKAQESSIETGLTASPGYFAGVVVFKHSTTSYGGSAGGNILVAKMTSTEDLAQIERCNALLSIDGGYTSHPAIVARELKKPCIVAMKNSHFINNDLVSIGGVEFKEGDKITVFADTGEIYKGHVEAETWYDHDDRFSKIKEGLNILNQTK
jgi:phosphoenolpyruvate synthase/pyruvate phosphate dikinase